MWEQVSEGEDLDSQGKESDKEEVENVQSDSDEDSESSDDLLVKIDPSKSKYNMDGEASEEEEKKEEFVVTKKQRQKMKKITADGPFGGKNKQMLGADGQQLTTLEALKEKNRINGEEGMNVINEAEANEMPQ